MNLIDWLKTMVENRKSMEVVDPNLLDMPTSKALKHILLVALMCVDPNASERPKMGQVIRMLDEVDLLVRHVCTISFFQLFFSFLQKLIFIA